MDENVTQHLGMTLETQIGVVDYRLQIPALSFASYMRMQRVLLRQPGTRTRKRIGWASLGSLAFWLTAGAMLGAIIGVLTAVHELSGGMWIASETLDRGLEMGGRGMLVLAFLLMVVTAVCGMLCLTRAQRAMLVRVHAAAGDLYGAHTLAIGERGLVMHNASRVLFVPWSSVTQVAKDQDGIFIVADHISAFWVTERVLAALPDRAAFTACLTCHMAAHPRTDRRPA
ncbi:YcxB family protein [Pigmentiphaga aceris]|uniref:YcxB family protein n=1 Tax=Pigmentiphaga aceris TaxID=1940612 RepID=A0A5C0B1M0_9BURK|nr:YcxB family protein [Pigmentiphaga aceris]QEI08699.1 YcxB family protein [Pigmentiphaga aceris]